MPPCAVCTYVWIDLSLAGFNAEETVRDSPNKYKEGILKRSFDYVGTILHTLRREHLLGLKDR